MISEKLAFLYTIVQYAIQEMLHVFMIIMINPSNLKL